MSIRILGKDHGRHPVLRALAAQFADAAGRFRDDFLNHTTSTGTTVGGGMGFGFGLNDTETIGGTFDFDLFSTAGEANLYATGFTRTDTARTRESDLCVN